MQEEGKILNLGVSVERVEEALKAIEYSNVTSIQIIFNLFRQRPAEHFFGQAAEKDVGIIARVVSQEEVWRFIHRDHTS